MTLQMPSYFEREVARQRAMIDEPINKTFVIKQIKAVEMTQGVKHGNI